MRIKEAHKHATETARINTNTTSVSIITQGGKNRKSQQITENSNNQEHKYHECNRKQTPTTQAQG
jgi:hypothetical protein